MRAGTHIDLSFWCKSRCFACTKRQVMSGTHRALLFRSISRCFASKNHRWGLEPIEPSDSGANHTVVHAQNERSCLGPLETCYSGPEFAVLHAETTGGVLNPQALVILMLGTLFCIQKTTGVAWVPIDTSNCGHKVAVLNAQNNRWGLEPIEPSISGANHAVVHAENKRSYLGPIETCYSGP